MGAIFWNAILEALDFERSEKAFHSRVIVAAGFAAHTGADIIDFKRLGELFGRVLNTAIGMMQGWSRWTGTPYRAGVVKQLELRNPFPF